MICSVSKIYNCIAFLIAPVQSKLEEKLKTNYNFNLLEGLREYFRFNLIDWFKIGQFMRCHHRLNHMLQRR